MQLGRFRLRTVSGGRFRIDGGTMFGVVPKALWNRVFPADENNTIAQATNCVLVETGEQTILIDTGYGSKLPERQRKVLSAEEGDPLLKSLSALGLSAEDIDLVVLSHLHFDHAGGATEVNEAGELVPTFPQAEYFAHRREWVNATADFPELTGAYPQENLCPLETAGRLHLLDGNAEIVPGLRYFVTGGHTEGHAVVVIESEGQAAVYLADLCPTTRHFPSRWGMAYDVNMLETRRQKPYWLGEIADRGWLALFDHDPDHAAAYLERDTRGEFRVGEAFVEL
jgi:glyoxylase-like metal-dependent hydrolase (beta-lactamase superfamily II)